MVRRPDPTAARLPHTEQCTQEEQIRPRAHVHTPCETPDEVRIATEPQTYADHARLMVSKVSGSHQRRAARSQFVEPRDRKRERRWIFLGLRSGSRRTKADRRLDALRPAPAFRLRLPSVAEEVRPGAAEVPALPAAGPLTT